MPCEKLQLVHSINSVLDDILFVTCINPLLSPLNFVRCIEPKGSSGVFNSQELRNGFNCGPPLVVEVLQGFQLEEAFPPDQGFNPWIRWGLSPQAWTSIIAPLWFTVRSSLGSYFYH